MRNMYIGDFIDVKKVEDSAFKLANDKKDPQDVIIHYHKHQDACDLSKDKKERVQTHVFQSAREVKKEVTDA